MVSPSGLVVDLKCGVAEVRESPRVPRRRILQGATTRNSSAISRRSNAAGPDASVLEWPRHFCDTTLNRRESPVDGMFYSMSA